MLDVSYNFDARSHITAGELRRLGFYLSEILDNRAYVRRVAVGLAIRMARGRMRCWWRRAAD